MVKMLDKVLLVKVKQSDFTFVKKLFPELEKEFKTLMKKETGDDYNCKLELDTHVLDSEW
jgi:hypothetical protein